MTIKAIIFDIGNVLIDINVDNAFSYWANIMGTTNLSTDLRNKSYFDFERGIISSHDYHRSIMKLLSIKISYNNFVYGWNLMLGDVKPGLIGLLEKLSYVKLAILSNTNSLHEKEIFSNYSDLMSHFAYSRLSHRIGFLKPEPEAYLSILEHLKIEPSQAIFIDDKKINIDAAQQLGMHTILSDNAKDIDDKIAKIAS